MRFRSPYCSEQYEAEAVEERDHDECDDVAPESATIFESDALDALSDAFGDVGVGGGER